MSPAEGTKTATVRYPSQMHVASVHILSLIQALQALRVKLAEIKLDQFILH